jgi:hypothetical protein
MRDDEKCNLLFKNTALTGIRRSQKVPTGRAVFLSDFPRLWGLLF